MPSDTPSVPLTFATADDADADRVTAVLYALGYDAVRVAEDHARPAREVALERLAKRCRLNEREAVVAAAIVSGQHSLEELAGVLVQSTATAKWVRRCVLSKAGCADDFALVVLVLSLCDAQAAPAEQVPAQESPAPVVSAGPSGTWL